MGDSSRGIIDKPCDLIPELKEDYEGPEHVDIVLLGYEIHRGEPSRYLVAVNQEYSNGFGNGIGLYSVERRPYMSLEYKLRQECMENARIKFGRFNTPEDQLIELKDPMPVLNYALVDVIEGNTVETYCNEYCRAQPFPVKRIKNSHFYSVARGPAEKISRLIGLLKDATEKEKRLIKEKLKEEHNEWGKEYWDYFTKLFEDDTEDFLFIPIEGLSSIYPEEVQKYPYIETLFESPRWTADKRAIKKHTRRTLLDYFIGSFRDIRKREKGLEKVLLAPFERMELSDKMRDTLELKIHIKAKEHLDSAWILSAAGHGASLSLFMLSALAFFPLEYFAATAPLLVDGIVRYAGFRVLDEPRTPGIIGWFKSGCEYVLRRGK